MTDRRTYWQRLKDHPGVPVATFMTIAGFLPEWIVESGSGYSARVSPEVGAGDLFCGVTGVGNEQADRRHAPRTGGRGMSDTMMFGIAKMPYKMAMRDELSRRQFYTNTQRLVASLEAALVDAERYRLLRKGAVDDVAVVRGLGAMDYGMSAVVATYSEEIDGDALDAAIDAAVQRAGEEAMRKMCGDNECAT